MARIPQGPPRKSPRRGRNVGGHRPANDPKSGFMNEIRVKRLGEVKPGTYRKNGITLAGKDCSLVNGRGDTPQNQD
jgi:hypothetical protein